MKISSGLFDNIVLQRDRRDKCDVSVRGASERTGEIYLRAGTARAWKRVSAVRRGKFQFRLTGIPVGGPYVVEVQLRHGRKILETLKVRNVLVGDVWLCAGQSNMQGSAFREDAVRPHPRVRAFYMDDRWDIAKDPVHNLWDSVDEVHSTIRGGRPGVDKVVGVGPAVAFGQEMHRRTGVPQGLISCSHGGTSMEEWSPSHKALGSHSLYGASIRRFFKNGENIAGIIWYQGESDASDKSTAQIYTEKMNHLVSSFRRDTKIRNLPFALVQISRVVGANFVPQNWNSIQEQQRLLSSGIPALVTVPSVDLELKDTIHISGSSCHRLGRRIADAMLFLAGKEKGTLPPIAFRSVSTKYIAARGHTEITVQFDNVKGSLRSKERPTGFSIADNAPISSIFVTELSGNKVILRTALQPSQLHGLSLHYGWGTDPYCNIHDAADRSLPVFGPFPLSLERPTTPYVRRFEVTSLLPGREKLHDLHYPKTETLSWEKIEFPSQIANMVKAFNEHRGEDKMLYYRCHLDVPEKMKLQVLFGYDGPVKLWIDGKELFHDPNGTTPMELDAQSISWNAVPGEHEVVVALGSNGREVWGITLRLERAGIPPLKYQKSPQSYPLPQFVQR